MGILTLNQLLNDEDGFLSHSMLRDKYHLLDITQWQHLQLQHLLTALLVPAVFSEVN